MQPLEEKPVKEVLVTLHTVSYLFALTALASAIAWIYFTAKAVEDDQIGGNHGKGDDSNATAQVNTVESMFEGAVIGLLLYLVFRHHFSESHL